MNGMVTGMAAGTQDSSGRVLILDEVDALVIDEEPNEPQLGSTSWQHLGPLLWQLIIWGLPGGAHLPPELIMQPGWPSADFHGLDRLQNGTLVVQMHFVLSFYLDALPFVA
eukprot:Skav221076  [mRNA]  locus=scaffold3118:370254:370586:- [translate_table: standard]